MAGQPAIGQATIVRAEASVGIPAKDGNPKGKKNDSQVEPEAPIVEVR